MAERYPQLDLILDNGQELVIEKEEEKITKREFF
jgi:hypothetical protein